MTPPDIHVDRYWRNSSIAFIGRPGKLSSVDRALKDWQNDKKHLNRNVNIHHLSRIILECQKYLSSRSHKPDSTRKTAVRTLGQEAFGRLKYEHYELRKQTKNSTGPATIGLGKGYTT